MIYSGEGMRIYLLISNFYNFLTKFHCFVIYHLLRKVAAEGARSAKLYNPHSTFRIRYTVLHTLRLHNSSKECRVLLSVSDLTLQTDLTVLVGAVNL